jgi:hypothetical protein
VVHLFSEESTGQQQPDSVDEEMLEGSPGAPAVGHADFGHTGSQEPQLDMEDTADQQPVDMETSFHSQQDMEEEDSGDEQLQLEGGSKRGLYELEGEEEEGEEGLQGTKGSQGAANGVRMFSPSFVGVGAGSLLISQQRQEVYGQEWQIGRPEAQHQEEQDDTQQREQEQVQQLDLWIRGCAAMREVGVLCWEFGEFIWWNLCNLQLYCSGKEWLCYGGLSAEELYDQLKSLQIGQVHHVVLYYYEQLAQHRNWFKFYHGEKGEKCSRLLELMS